MTSKYIDENDGKPILSVASLCLTLFLLLVKSNECGGSCSLLTIVIYS